VIRRALLLGVLVASCAGPTTPPPSAPAAPAEVVPTWVRRTPAPDGEVCAVGAVDRTFYAQDALRRAGDAARGELAKTVEVRVKSVMYDYRSSRGSGGGVTTDIVEVVESVSEGVLHGAEVRATWQDDAGRHLAAGMTYALACLRIDVPVERLAEALRAARRAGEPSDADVDGVRERARAAFEALEAEEEARGTPRDVNTANGASVPRSEEVP